MELTTMAFIDSIDDEFKIKIEEESQTDLLEVWKYLDNDTVFKLKFWYAKNSLNEELAKEIWLNETRQLNKLKSVTNAEKYLEVIHDSFIDNSGNYCLIYPTDQDSKALDTKLIEIEAKPARIGLFSKSKSHWLSKDKIISTTSRMFLWKNVLRLIEGIEILHGQDIIHRNINTNSVIYKENEEIDDTERFVLSGFEKSLDFNKINKPIFMGEHKDVICTTHQDWSDLGVLILELLGIDSDSFHEKLLRNEALALRLLLEGHSTGHTKLVDKTQLKLLVEQAVTDLSEVDNSFSPVFYITTASFDSDIFGDIRNVIKNYLIDNAVQNYDAQNLTSSDVTDIIKEDITLDPFRIFNDRYRNEFILKGKNFLYRFKEFKHDNFGDWYVSYITAIYDSVPDWLNYAETIEIKGSLVFIPNAFRLMQKNEFSDENSWKLKLIQFKKEQKYTDSELQCLQGLLLSFAIDVARSETEKYLISLDRIEDDRLKEGKGLILDDGLFYYTLEYKKENNDINNKLSDSLSLRQPFDRFKQHFSDPSKLTDKWVIETTTKSRRSMERKDKLDAQYVGLSPKLGYIFSTKQPLERSISNLSEELVRIYPKDHDGTIAQIERRARIFYFLLNQSSLISSIADPAKKFFVTSRKFDLEASLTSLDESKKEVFSSLVKTQPNYFIEGPPGVGKTHLITTYVDYLFHEENSSKVLLSAQSHATVNMLYDEITEKLREHESFDSLVIIPNFKAEKNDDGSNVETLIQNATNPYIDKFKKSEMFSKYSKEPLIKQKLDKFVNKSDVKFFNQVLRAANLVFTTSNSKLMEGLIENNINFDVSVMEECGKTSGIELVSPMIVSSKRVLIGDYKQLPAFSEQDVQKIIRNPGNFDMSLVVEQLSNIGFKKGVIFDLDFNYADINKTSKAEHFSNLSKYFSLFKSLCQSAESIRSRGKESFGSMIDTQHRMHPQISRIVSNAVYDGKLKDDPQTADFYNSASPFIFKDSKLEGLNKDNAVIWVDLPDKNSDVKMPRLENKNVNKHEIRIIKELLSKIHTNSDEDYSIKILSPYVNQVNMINNLVEKSEINSCFLSKYNDQDIAKTVDSYQGDQADVIIISLVRHNSYQPITSALGFLSDMRRMNVLLSRAKHKMIIVGCFGLFRNWQLLENKAHANNRGCLDDMDRDFLNLFVEMFNDDFEVMNDHSIDTESKVFNNINFVQSKSFLDL